MFDKKDFKYIVKKVIIGLTIAFILFNINKCNAYALVSKDRVNTQFDSSTKQGYFANQNTSGGLPYYLETWVSFQFTNAFPVQNTDYLLFQFVREEYNLFEGENNFCSEYIQRPSSSSNVMSTITCNPDSYHTSYNINNNLNKSMFIKYTDNSIDYCWFDSTMQGYAICPNGKKQIDSFWMHYTGTYRRVEYRLQISTIIYLYNNESTEIVNALNGVTLSQNNTTTAVNNTLNTINDSNTTTSSTSGNNALSGFNSSISTGIDNSVGATSLYTLLTNFTNQLSDTTCQPIVLPIPYTNENLTLPCLGTEFANRIPIIWNVYQLIILGAFALAMWQNATEFVFKVMDPYYAGANNLPIGGGK